MKIIGISGSPTRVSRSNWLLTHFIDTLNPGHPNVQTLDPIRIRELPAQALLHAELSAPELQAAVARLADADVVVIATPIYKAAYSGLLKVFLDLLPQDGLRNKAVVVLATGGSPAHLLAVDYALKPVLSALGTRDILDAVYATDVQLPKVDGDTYTRTDEVELRLNRAAELIRKRIPASVLHLASQRVAPLPEGIRISA